MPQLMKENYISSFMFTDVHTTWNVRNCLCSKRQYDEMSLATDDVLTTTPPRLPTNLRHLFDRHQPRYKLMICPPLCTCQRWHRFNGDCY